MNVFAIYYSSKYLGFSKQWCYLTVSVNVLPKTIGRFLSTTEVQPINCLPKTYLKACCDVIMMLGDGSI